MMFPNEERKGKWITWWAYSSENYRAHYWPTITGQPVVMMFHRKGEEWNKIIETRGIGWRNVRRACEHYVESGEAIWTAFNASGE